MKLVVAEAESAPLAAAAARWPETVSSVVLAVELRRAVRRGGLGSTVERRVDEVLDGVHLVSLDERVLEAAAGVDPPELRTLDAIHLATILTLGDAVSAVAAYDRRLADAVAPLGLEIVAPTA